MGCTVSTAATAPQHEHGSGDTVSTAPPTEERATHSKWALLKGHQATLMATWLELCGAMPAASGDEEVPTLGCVELLSRSLSPQPCRCLTAGIVALLTGMPPHRPRSLAGAMSSGRCFSG